MASELALTGADKLLTHLPAFLLRRMYTRTRLDREILIDVRVQNGIRFILGSYVPMGEVWFTLTNFTNLGLKVREFSGEVHSEGRSHSIMSFYDRPLEIKRKQTAVIYTKCMLNEFQVARLKELKKQPEGYQIATIYVRAQLDSKIGTIECNPTIPDRAMIILV